MRLLLLLTAFAVLAAPAAYAQKDDGKPEPHAAANSEHPFVGEWDYVVSAPGDEETGTFTIVQHGEALGGTFISDVTSPIYTFEPEGDAVAFTFKHPEMGVISIRGTLSGDRFEGEAQLEGLDALPFVATRQISDGTDAQ